MKPIIFATQLEKPTGEITKIDVLSAGEFMDSMGRIAAFKTTDLQTYVANTKKALASTVDGNGVLVGFPIDSMDHDHSVAAGWIKDVELDAQREKVVASVVWNELGTELIQTDQMRYFSAEADLRAKVLMGGTLTNWPATRNKENEIMLQPVTLSMAMFSLNGESLDAMTDAVRMAFYEQYAEYDYNSWPVEVFDTYLICHKDDAYYQAKYTTDADGAITFDEMEKWTKVKRQWVEMAMQALKRVFSGFSMKASDEPNSNSEDVMNELDKLPPEQRTALLSLAKQQLAADLSANSKDALPELATLIQSRIDTGITAGLAMEQRKQHVAQFAARAVSGTKDKPNGLPIAQDKLEAIMLSLPEDKQADFEAVVDGILEKGLVPFAELGHEKLQTGNTEIPEEIKLSLKGWLDAGKTIEEFFTINPEMGAMSDYNLAEFTKKKEA